jgi:membrane protease subunit HflK
MVNLYGWLARAGVLKNDNKGPWGGSGGGGDGSGSGGDGGPRNPWAFPPGGKRAGQPGPSTLDEFLKRARRRGGGGGGGGFPGGFGGAGSPALWAIGAGLIALLWIAFTSFHLIRPEQRGVVTTFGQYTGTLEPGFQFTLPAPISSVTTVDVQQIRTEDFPTGTGENLMLTRDQNIVDLAYSVRWDIRNSEDYAFQIANPPETVRAVAESAMRAVIASVLLNEAIGAGRTVIEAEVKEMMQRILDEYQSGVRVQGVAIKQASPPEAVDEAFKQVTAAQQEAQGALNQARAYAEQIKARAEGEAAQFDQIYAQYRLAPEVTRRRLYYETMEEVLAKANKTIVETRGVTPYLPLPEAGRRPAEPPAPVAAAPAPAAPQGGAR